MLAKDSRFPDYFGIKNPAEVKQRPFQAALTILGLGKSPRFFIYLNLNKMASPAKIKIAKNLKKQLKKAPSAALIDYQGLSAEQFSELRREVKQAQGKVRVIKNNLISRALNGLGIKLPEKLVGQTAVVWSKDDEIAPLKAVDRANQKWEKPVFKLGIYQNELLSLEKLQAFVRLPAKETLAARFVGGLKNPLQRLAGAMRYNQTKLVLTLQEIAKAKE